MNYENGQPRIQQRHSRQLGLTIERCIFWTHYQQTYIHEGEVKIKNNTVYGCYGGFDLAGLAPVPGSVLNNVFVDVTTTALVTNASGPYIDYNLYDQNGVNVQGGNPGDESVMGDPFLVSPPTHDFSLLPTSPVSTRHLLRLQRSKGEEMILGHPGNGDVYLPLQ